MAEKLEGFFSSFATAETKPKPLADKICRFVLLSNWDVANDAADTATHALGADVTDIGQEIYWGFAGVPVHQLFPQQSTILIPVSNANQIFVRCKKGGANKVITYSCFK